MSSSLRMRCLSSVRAPGSRTSLILLLSAFSAGCSADVARFDFPSASLADHGGTTTGAIPTPSEPLKQRSNLIGSEATAGSDGAGGSSEGGAYYPPKTPGREPMKMAALPDAAPPPADLPAATQTKTFAPEAPQARSQQPAPIVAATQAAAERGEQIEVQPGDTLFGLSKRHHVSVSELMATNELKGPALKPGQKLYLPATKNARLPLQKAAPAAVTAAAAPADWTGSYTVKQGDSLYAIARQHKVKFTDLQRYNGIQDVRRVKPGMVLKMPAGDGPALAEAAPSPAPAPETPAAQAQPTPAAPSQSLAAAAQQEQAVSAAPSVQPSILNAAPQPEQKVAAIAPQSATDATSAPAAAAAPSPTKQASGSVASSGKLRWPVQGKIISAFGQRTDGTHNDGVNLAVPLGTEVHAAEDGVVAYAGSELKGYGNLILVRHDNGWVTAYAHADELLVERGDKVSRGQVIAKAGKSGQVDQPQVHFELRQGQKPVDPTPFMEKI